MVPPPPHHKPNSDGRREIATLHARGGPYTTFNWHPAGHSLALAAADGHLHYWDYTTEHLHDVGPVVEGVVISLAFDPTSGRLASATRGALAVSRRTSESHALTIDTGDEGPTVVLWQPTEGYLISCDYDGTVRTWDPDSGYLIRQIHNSPHPLWGAAFEVIDGLLAVACEDGTIKVWREEAGEEIGDITQHDGPVLDVAWKPRGNRQDALVLASGSADGTVRIWLGPDPAKGSRSGHTIVLERHTEKVTEVNFSSDGSLLASTAIDGTTLLWDTVDWAFLCQLPKLSAGTRVEFHPSSPVLARFDIEQQMCDVWHLDAATLAGTDSAMEKRYRNAKVVLMGDSSVGKSGLALVLTGHNYQATESTHGRKVWTFASTEV